MSLSISVYHEIFLSMRRYLQSHRGRDYHDFGTDKQLYDVHVTIREYVCGIMENYVKFLFR